MNKKPDDKQNIYIYKIYYRSLINNELLKKTEKETSMTQEKTGQR